MTIIYRPTAADRPHLCTVAKSTLPPGSICRCDCGKFWLRKTVVREWVTYWVPVRWYHRAARKRVREWQNRFLELTRDKIKAEMYAKLRDTVPGEGWQEGDRPGGETPVQTRDEAYVQAQKDRLRSLMEQAREKVKNDSRTIWPNSDGTSTSAADPFSPWQRWQQADDRTSTRFQVTAKIYGSPFDDAPYTTWLWKGTRFQIGEMAGEYADGTGNPLLHMEIDTVEVLDE